MRALTRRHALAFAGLGVATTAGRADAAPPRWETLPPTPTLPNPQRSGLAPVNGIHVWHAVFEPRTPSPADPVILLHGGLANSNYWGLLVPALAADRRVIVMDSRGHGRSTRDARPFGYDLMADDVLALLDFLKTPKAALVGWSDGAIIGLDIAIRKPDRLSRVFAFAANSDPSGVKDVDKSPVFTAYIARAGREYRRLSPTPNGYKSFVEQIGKMWATQPHFTDDQLRGIRVPTWIVDGDHDEAIKRENTDHMASLIPGAREVILADVSHFAFLQDSTGFNAAVRQFLTAG
jgi:pimeloyl-ACP methyl ester carboxylesterase